MIRTFDFIFALLGLLITAPITFLIFFICYWDTGFPLYRQYRVGLLKKKFLLIKFRTMHLNTQSVATHMVNKNAVTKIGRFLRTSKLDEIPQLWNVLNGDMSLVGPRPSLLNQLDVIAERDKLNVYNIKPGITGLSQVRKIDMSTPELLAATDALMLQENPILRYFKYVLLTIFGKGRGDRVNYL
jgi:lipopolysaccharide/colanic/teichoic acid biosynthesis glycosyltransferase